MTDVKLKAEHADAALGAAIPRVKQADAQLRIAGAALLPSVQANASPSRQQIVFPTINGPIPYTSYTVGISASYEIDFWGKNAAARDAAKATSVASRYDQQVVALTVVSGVATTYF